MSLLQVSTDLIVHAISLFDTKEKATLVVLLMFALCAASAGWLLVRHLRFVRPIRRADSAVRAALAQGNLAPADRLNEIEKALRGHAVLGDAWSRYRATLRDDPRTTGGFVNLVDPAAWFAARNLPGGGYEKWAATWASVFLCLGLLFTFIGLSAALMKLGDVADAAKLREGINGVLSVSSAKFMTSIVGIMLFIGWVIFGRAISAGQHGAAAGFAASVQRATTMLTPEVLLMDQLLASREQADRMKTMKDDIAVAFEAKLSSVVGARLDSFPDQFGKSVQPVVEAINGIGGTISQGADDALARVADRMEQTAAALQAAQGGIGTSGDIFGRSVAQAATVMSDTVANMTSALDAKVASLEERIASVNTALQSGATSISGIAQGMGAATSAALKEAFEAVAAQATKGAEQARAQAEASIQPLFLSMQALAEQIRRQADEGSGSLVEGSRSAAKLLTSAAGGVNDRMAELEARIRRMDEAMDRGAQAITGVSAGMSDAAGTTLARALEAIADQSKRGAEQAREQTIAAVQPLMTSMQEVMAELRARAAEGSGHLVTGGKSAADALTSAAAGISSTMTALEARIGNIDAALAKGSQSISSVGDELARSTSTALGQSLRTIGDEAARGAEQARQQSQAAMGPLLEGLKSLAEQIRDQASIGRDSLVDGGESAARSLAAAAEAMGERLTKATREASEGIQGAAQAMADRMEAAVAQFQAVEAAVAAHVGHLQRTGTTITAAGATFDAAAGQLRRAAEPVEASLASVDSAARKATETLEAATSLQLHISEASNAMRDSIGLASASLTETARTAQQAFEDYKERFQGVDIDLRNTVEGLRNGVTGIGDEAATMVKGAKEQLANALGALSGGVTELSDAVADMQATAERLEQAMRQRAGALR